MTEVWELLAALAGFVACILLLIWGIVAICEWQERQVRREIDQVIRHGKRRW